jgi:hypothetical protein
MSMARLATVLASAAVGLCSSAAAVAQQTFVEPSAAQKCLTLAPEALGKGAPAYPFVQFKLGTRGRVLVALSFSTPDRRPAVEVLEREGGDEFVEAVEDHVRHLRVPCLVPGQPAANLRFEFLFRPDDINVATAHPLDARAKAREAMIACVRHASGQRAPSYPMQAAREGRQGRVLARLRFEAPDRPPIVQTFARRSAGVLRNDVEDWVSDFRMPCHQGEPVEYDIVFVYVMEGSHYGFRPDTSFPALVSLVPPAHRAKLPPDTTGMGCPFDVSLLYRKPDLSNRVAQLGNYNAARQPMLEWLAEAELLLPRQSSDSIFGDSTRFTVPCLKL